MPHYHDHVHRSPGDIRSAFFLNLGFTVVEIIGEIWINSTAIVDDPMLWSKGRQQKRRCSKIKLAVLAAGEALECEHTTVEMEYEDGDCRLRAPWGAPEKGG